MYTSASGKMRADYHKLSSDFHMHTVAHMHLSTYQTNKQTNWGDKVKENV